MKPRDFEKFVADYYKNQGYETELTSYTRDDGIDVIAQKGTERIAVQAKMYGNSSRKVNRQTVMELYGAMTLQKCNKAVIATDGNCMPDAIEVAKSLGMEILYLSSTKGILSVELEDEHHNFTIVSESASNAMLFDDMWDKYIMPLSGKTISHDGLTNRILDVDWGGLCRLSSKGRVGNTYGQLFLNVYKDLENMNENDKEFMNNRQSLFLCCPRYHS